MITQYDIEELACHMLGVDYDDMVNNYEENVIDDMFHDKYQTSLENFYYIIEDLIRFTPTWESPINSTVYHGFIDNGFVLVKQKV